MAEIVFKDMDNYYISMMMNPDVYNFMKVSATINKHGSSKVYKIVRTMEYSSSFNGLRDRMYAGVLAIYNHMFKELEDLEDLQKGPVKNYFCIAVETTNDFKKQVLSYDMYFIKSPSWEQLIKSKEYDMIPNVDNEEKHIAIFNFGYQYEEDMDKINLESKIYHIKAYKAKTDTLLKYTIPNNQIYDRNNQEHKNFINSLFYGDNISNYAIGISVEDKNNKGSKDGKN